MSTSLRTKLVGVALATSVAFGGSIAVAQLADAHEDREARIQEKLDDGTITEERAEELRQRMAEREARRTERQAQRDERREAIATILGTTVEDLRADLRAGSTMAELAEAAGVDIELVIDELLAAKETRLDEAVAADTIDQSTADERLEAAREKITARVNGERPDRADRPHRPGRGGHGRGHHHGN